MIPFEKFEKMMRQMETNKRYCCEIYFQVAGSEKFNDCWMGKTYCEADPCDTFWFGLTEDGAYAFDYQTFDEMANDPVFDGKTLKELWPAVVIEMIDDMDPEERIKDYLRDGGPQRYMGKAQ